MSWKHSFLPVTVEDSGPGGPILVRVPEGTLQVAELHAAGTLFTVPAGQVLTGLLCIVPGAAQVTVSAATGGTISSHNPAAGQPVEGPFATEVKVAGGGSGNAISVTGSPASVVLAGYLA